MGAMDSVAVGGRCPFGLNRCALRSNNRLPPPPRIVNRNRLGLREQRNVTVDCLAYRIWYRITDSEVSPRASEGFLLQLVPTDHPPPGQPHPNA
jgi:hypothetical protein